MGAPTKIYQLKVTLMDCAPPIWRRITMPASMTLADLHQVLQVLMGWQEYHLWAFEAGGQRFEVPDPENQERAPDARDPRRVKLGNVLARKGAKLRYNYDYGDDWWLEIEVEAISKPEPRTRYPRCLAGKRAGPPEDCGGPPGLEELLAARKKPKSRRSQELLEWAGPDWDPDAFDLAAVNKELTAQPAPHRMH